jgi:TDG/mug DNA glycosylase family protein
LASVGYRHIELWRGIEIPTLRDIIPDPLIILFVGLNPSPVSVAAGHYHQGRLGKRFWAMLQAFGLLPAPEPGDYHDDLLEERGFGITDLAKLPTPRATGLTREDTELGREVLLEKILRLRPRIVCSVYKSVLETLVGHKLPGFGGMRETIGESRLFALPFPYRPRQQVEEHMTELRALVAEVAARA